MKVNEIVLTETWPLQLVKAFNMLRKSQKFKHLPDEKIKQMAHAVVKKWNDPATPAPKPKPHTVQDLTRQYKIDKKVMDDEEFKKFYGFSKYSKGKFVENYDYDADLPVITELIIESLHNEDNWDENGDVNWDFVASDVWIAFDYEGMGYDAEDFNNVYMDAANRVAKRFGTNPPYHSGLAMEDL